MHEGATKGKRDRRCTITAAALREMKTTSQRVAIFFQGFFLDGNLLRAWGLSP